jgi:hypothetical protein
MRISFLHTAQVHVDTFDTIFKTLAPDVVLNHVVVPELLSRAQMHGLDDVREETTNMLAAMRDDDAAVCTCTTLGPIADALGGGNLLRIDRPVMEYACAQGSRILVAICLEATRVSTCDLLANCAQGLGANITPDIILIDSAWPYFENGEIDHFAAEIAVKIKSRVAQDAFDCVVLAQASMHVAEPLLQDIGIPVVSSPVMAAKRALGIAKRSV